MRSLRWKGDRQWRAAREWRILSNEDEIRRHPRDPKNGLMFLSVQVDDATTK